MIDEGIQARLIQHRTAALNALDDERAQGLIDGADYIALRGKILIMFDELRDAITRTATREGHP